MEWWVYEEVVSGRVGVWGSGEWIDGCVVKW